MPTFVLSRRHALVAVACAVGLVLVASRIVGAPGQPTPPAPASPIVSESSVPRSVVVDVEGAVLRPGLYHLRSGARIADAIAKAGGVTRNADRSAVNLAAPVADGVQVLVPSLTPGGTGVARPSAAPSGGPVNLNSATTEQLDALPGIGPVTAEKIVEYRREHGLFRSVDELDAIAGIGPTRIDNLRGHVVP